MATQPAFASPDASSSPVHAVQPIPRLRALPRLADRWLPVVLMALPPLLYLPYVTRNLPVASHWDERGALVMLLRFHQGSLNPHFFMYPTLYFYCLHLLLAPFAFSNATAMVVGRLFNLVLIGVTAAIVYAFCRDRLHSRAAGVLAAIFILGSAILSEAASYIHPDLLMTAAGTGALYYLVGFFNDGSRRAWLLGILCIGFAVGCKYTAILLYIAYFLTEALLSFRSEEKPVAGVGRLSTRFRRSTCVAALAAASISLIVLEVSFPIPKALHFIAAMRSNLDVRPEGYYLDFFRHLRSSLLKAGVALAAAALLCRVSCPVYRALSLKRQYYALGIVLLLSVLSTPFALVTPRAFLFDLGALARSNLVVAGGQAQWVHYALWLVQREGAVPILLSLLGLAAIATQRPRFFAPVTIYLILYLLVLGTSQAGFVRYLAPVLPIFYAGAGFGLVKLWNLSQRRRQNRLTLFSSIIWQKITVLLLLAVAFFQTGLHVAASRRQGRETNAFLASYWVARRATTGTAFYAGYAPYLELSEAGVKTSPIAWPSLLGTPLGSHLACGDVLILDKARATQLHLDPLRDGSILVLFDPPAQQEQVVVRRSHCSAVPG